MKSERIEQVFGLFREHDADIWLLDAPTRRVKARPEDGPVSPDARPALHVDTPVFDYAEGHLAETYGRLHFVVPELEPWMATELVGVLQAGDEAGGSVSISTATAEIVEASERLVIDTGDGKIRVSRARTSVPEYFPSPKANGASMRIQQDLITREVSILAVALDRTWTLIDPYGGIADRRVGLLRSVVSPRRLLSNSSVWLLKMAVHAAREDMPVEREFTRLAWRHSANAVGFRPETLRDALERCFVEARSAIPFDFVADTGLLSLLLPEVDALRGFEKSSPVHHKDLWDHTVRVALQIEPEPGLRWTALLHDVGKVQSRRVEARRVSFLRHEDIGAYLFQGIARRLDFPEELATRVEYLIRHHSRINHYGDEWTDTAIRRLVRDTEYVDDLLRFSRADVTSRIPGRVEALHRLLDELRRRMVEIEARDNEPPLLPRGLGNELMERFELTPGPLIGVIRQYFEDEVQQERLERNAESGYYIRYVEEHPELLETWKCQKPVRRRQKKERTAKSGGEIR